jgi:hypothetical protein
LRWQADLGVQPLQPFPLDFQPDELPRRAACFLRQQRLAPDEVAFVA